VHEVENEQKPQMAAFNIERQDQKNHDMLATHTVQHDRHRSAQNPEIHTRKDNQYEGAEKGKAKELRTSCMWPWAINNP